MIERLFIVTNNPLAKEKFEPNYTVEFIEGSVEDVYKAVRNKIHLGHKLLTHPLMSSVKPNETPFRTVCVSVEKLDAVDFQSLSLMENSIMTLHKFLNMSAVPKYTEDTLYDFQVIDYDLINHAIN